MTVASSDQPQINFSGQRISHLRLRAALGEFSATTRVRKIRSRNDKPFGFRQLRFNADYTELTIRIVGKRVRGVIDDPPSGPLIITLANGPVKEVTVPVEYVDDPEDTEDDPNDP